jgi:autotransporter translocation and assembly factor TamB
LSNIKGKKKFTYWLLIIVLIIIAFAGICYIYINSESFRGKVEARLTTLLENSLGNTIEIGGIDSISFKSIQINNIAIFENGSAGKNNPLFQADGAKAEFAFLFPIFQWNNWQLKLNDVTFYNATTSLTRYPDGQFDFVQKFKFDPEQLQENIIINRIHFQDSYLTYHDELIYNYDQDYLTTRAKNIEGYFDLSQLPKIGFDFQGIQEDSEALLAIQGQFSIQEPVYSLDFHLENADITHFQYYLEVAEQFSVNQGKFDIDFNLSRFPESEDLEVNWKGKATFQEASLKPQFLSQIPFDKVNGSVQFVKPKVTITEMTGLYNDNDVQLKGYVTTEPEVYFDLDIASNRVNATHLKSDISLFLPEYNDFSLEGEIDLSGNIKGGPEDFQIEGKGYSPEIFLEDIPFQKVECSFLLGQNELLVKSLKMDEPKSSLLANGNINWSEDSFSYQFLLETNNFPLRHPLFKQLNALEGYSGNIDSNFQLENQQGDGSVLNINGQFTVDAIANENLSLSKQLQGNIISKLDFPNKLLSVQECELGYDQNKSSVEGEIHLEEMLQFELDFGCQISTISELINDLDLEVNLAGAADVEGTLSGNLQQPELSASFNLQEFSIQENLLGKLMGELDYKDNVLSFNTLELTNDLTKLTGDGKIAFNKTNPPEIDFSYQLHNINLNTFLQNIDDITLPLSGQLSSSGSIEGTWPGLSAEGNCQLQQIAFQDYSLGQGQFDFYLQPEEKLLSKKGDNNIIGIFNLLGYSYSCRLENFNMKNEAMTIKAKGESKIEEDYPFSMEIDFMHNDLEDITEKFYPDDNYFKKFLPSEIQGKVNLKGDKFEQNISLSAQLIPQQKNNNPPSQLNSVISINEQGWLISNFSLVQTEGQFTAQGSISNTDVLDISFQAEQLDLEMLTNLVQIDETVRGIMDVEGSFEGTIKQPQISMTANIEKGNIREFQFNNLVGNLYWNSQKNEIEITELNVNLGENNHIRAQGNLPFSIFKNKERDEMLDINSQVIPLDFQINMEKADLNLLRLFWKDAFSEVMGNTDLELFLTGTTENPVFNGIIDINNGEIVINNLPIQLEKINTRIEISDNQVNVPKIPFVAYENNFNISGKFEMINFVPENINLTVEATEKNIAYQDILNSKANLWTEIKGSLAEPNITGKLTLSNGTLNLQELMQLYEENELTILNNNSMANDLQNYLDFNIEIADPFTLKMPDAEINITGNINLDGSFVEPIINGNLTLKNGYIIYFEKRFVISGGRVTINGVAIEDIIIDAKANTTVQDVQIFINMSGSLANPQISLSSQPALKETEIISLLTFNRNIQGLSEGEIDQILSQEMIDIIFQSLQINLFRRMERSLAEELGFEFIRFSYDISEDTQSNLFFLEDMDLGDLTLEVGKSITDDIFVTYSTPLDFTGETSLGIDYEISSSFTFNTQFDTYSLKEEDYRFKFGLEFRF